MLDRNFNTLSGGEKTICLLIRLILIEPNIVLLDEPTNHLDIKRIEWLEKYLNSIKSTVVLVSHDRYFINKIVTHIVEIKNKCISKYIGNYDNYKNNN